MTIFDKDNAKIMYRDGKYYLGMEDGGHVSRYWEIEISKEDVEKVMQDVMYGVKLMIDYQNKLWGLT